MGTWENTTRFDSTDTSVSKFVFTKEGAIAEAVLYRYHTFEKRTVICCSVMSGCPMGCIFCGTGNKFVRNLTVEEIVAQPVSLLETTGVEPEKIEKLQIMFMSMGEPMLNIDNVIGAIRELHRLFPNAQLLVSTAAPRSLIAFRKFQGLSEEIEEIGLQFSVHESTDEARERLIPKPTFCLEAIAQLGEFWARATGRHPFFNYCVHEGNSSPADADRLAKLFKPDVWRCTLSVICEKDEHVANAIDRQLDLIQGFSQLLLEKGFDVRVFNPAGQDDIGGGCGQLWFVQQWMRENEERSAPPSK